METAIETANGAADFLAKDLVDALKDLPENATRAAFVRANDRAGIELRAFAAYLKEQKLPRAHARYALGRAKYARMLAAGEMISLPPVDLLRLGERELGREQARFALAARQMEPDRPPVEVFKAIQKDHPTAECLIADTAKNLEAIRRFLLEHRIVTLPADARAQAAETPQFLRATSFASMDTPGPFETKAAEAFYYVTPVEKDWPPAQKEEWLTAFNYYTTDVVSIHEAYPGHYTQFLCLNASPATKVEKIFNSYAFIEGWAHYAEQMMIEEGFGVPAASGSLPDPARQAAKYRLAQSDEALLRLCRLCVSIKIHCQGMTVEQATRFFQDNCYYEEKTARSEALRGAFDPEYLYYSLGKLEFLKLREDYRKQKGTSFTPQTFHDEVLRHGAPPLRLLREVLLKDRRIWGDLLP